MKTNLKAQCVTYKKVLPTVRAGKRVLSKGFTIIELMVAVAIIAILLGLGAPSVRMWVTDARVKAAALDLVSDIYVARASALKLNCDVSIVKADASNWAAGWSVVYEQASATDPACVASGGVENVLKVQEPYAGIDITGPAGSSLVFGFDGRVVGITESSAKFQVTPSVDKEMVKQRCIRLSPSGKPQTLILDSDAAC